MILSYVTGDRQEMAQVPIKINIYLFIYFPLETNK